MKTELLTALAAFSLVSSITPGPNNLMLMASGANFGFRRTLPHMMGVNLGFTLMVALVGLGLVGLFDLYPVAKTVLTAVSVAYLVYLAWKIARAGAPKAEGETAARPFTFLQAAAFQWVNPKAWTMALTAMSAYAPGGSARAALLVAAVFGLVNLPSIVVWVVAGQGLRRFLTNARRLTLFNYSMAGLLLASLYPVVFPR
ncbi:MAG: LysE family translocator [Notoacmeibacter sp.]|nr:LysE family translocator [Notoacmeibacter sp.]MCC0033032.1 LysE family translocator [Brucellaceae bacterium]